jgi:hypothetical protein
MRYIQRVLQHTRPIRRLDAEPEFGKVAPFFVPPKSERRAMVVLKTRGFGPAPVRKFVSTRLRAYRAVQRRKISPQTARQKGEWMEISEILTYAL